MPKLLNREEFNKRINKGECYEALRECISSLHPSDTRNALLARLQEAAPSIKRYYDLEKRANQERASRDSCHKKAITPKMIEHKHANKSEVFGNQRISVPQPSTVTVDHRYAEKKYAESATHGRNADAYQGQANALWESLVNTVGSIFGDVVRQHDAEQASDAAASRQAEQARYAAASKLHHAAITGVNLRLPEKAIAKLDKLDLKVAGLMDEYDAIKAEAAAEHTKSFDAHVEKQIAECGKARKAFYKKAISSFKELGVKTAKGNSTAVPNQHPTMMFHENGESFCGYYDNGPGVTEPVIKFHDNRCKKDVCISIRYRDGVPYTQLSVPAPVIFLEKSSAEKKLADKLQKITDKFIEEAQEDYSIRFKGAQKDSSNKRDDFYAMNLAEGANVLGLCISEGAPGTLNFTSATQAQASASAKHY